MEAAEHYRLFLALLVPETVKDELERVQEQLRREIKAEARWAHREQWHLTLKFLGNVEVAQLSALTTAVRGACEAFGPLALRAEEIGCFPNPRLPRVIWAGVKDQEQQLEALADSLQEATLPFTKEEPADKFVGHITLARLKGCSRGEAVRLEQLGARLSQRCFGTWTGEGVSLMRSQLGPGGAKHSELERIGFGKGVKRET